MTDLASILNIEDVLKNLREPARSEDPPWLKKLKDSFKTSQSAAPSEEPQAGPLEFELWLASLVRALANARVASTDWMALVSAQDAISLQVNEGQMQMQSLVGEEIPSRLFNQTQLDHQIQQSEIAAVSREEHAGRLAKVISKVELERERAVQAHRALAFVQFNRDTSPAPAENFAKGRDDRFVPFDANGSVLHGSIGAAEFLATQAMEVGLARDKDERENVNHQASQLRAAQLSMRESIENIDVEAQSLAKRKALLEQRLAQLSERLKGKNLDFDRRTENVLKSYQKAISSVEARARGLASSLELVFQSMAPDELLQELNDSARAAQEDRGSQLDVIEMNLRGIEDWLGAIAARTFRTVWGFPVELINEDNKAFSGKCLVELGKIVFTKNLDLFRVRGVRLLGLGASDPIPGVQVICSPSNPTQVIAGLPAPSTQPTRAASQHGWLTSRPESTEGFWGTKNFWNVAPVGEWTIEVSPTFLDSAHKTPKLKCVFELLVDYREWITSPSIS
ncbi:hypothetical protein QTI51_23020 [Variovorax sp. J22G73]|uniref:hypothetical protein n=1 Tax=unclassified Variovorax TaxID=663243 RepID=UPI0025784208|nr:MULTISPECIES: hypothetical protein [unclassified Variovorax]MDM0007465.1 hypothetical protein [Variovorax sp. J22R203]MDM0100175.1 hypothetical protein [Variovorax sp. J22G73]